MFSHWMAPVRHGPLRGIRNRKKVKNRNLNFCNARLRVLGRERNSSTHTAKTKAEINRHDNDFFRSSDQEDAEETDKTN